MPPARLQFVVTTGQNKADPGTRKLIRSHVMVGKNRGRCLGPKRKPARTSESTDHNTAIEPGCRSSAGPPYIRPTLLPKAGSDLSFMQLADDVCPRSVMVVLEYFNFIKKGSFPVEDMCLVRNTTYSWPEHLAEDPALLHALIFMATDLFNTLALSLPTRSNTRTLPHFLKTVAIITERIQTSDATVYSESTIAAVMALVGHAHVMGEYENARHHLEGARRMILMRGGVDTLGHNTRMLIDIVRADVGLAIRTGLPPLIGELFLFSSSFSPSPPLVLVTEQHLPSTPIPPAIQNPTMRDAYTSLLTLSTTMNATALSASNFLATLSSLPYALIRIPPPCLYHNHQEALEEAFRLALLVFITTLVFTWDGLGFHTAHICGAYGECLVRVFSMLEEERGSMSREMSIWFLVLGCITRIGAPPRKGENEEGAGDWMGRKLRCEVERRVGGKIGWEEMRGMLKEVLWVDGVHDPLGRKVFDEVIGMYT